MANGVKDQPKLLITHQNIRESISILVIKLIVIDILTAIFVGVIFIGGTTDKILNMDFPKYSLMVVLIFTMLVVLKIGLTAYVVIEWLNEYYEIFPEYIIRKRGVFFRKEKRQNLKGVTEIKVYQPVAGKLLNFGTIILYNYRKMELMTLYLIHNPTRYEKLINELIGGLSEEKEVIRQHVIEEGD